MKAYLSIFILCLLMISCSDFLEDDITDDTIILLTPADGNLSLQNAQQFIWESLEGATGYEIQIVTPSFDSIAAFTVKTDLGNTTQYDTTLSGGQYEWKIIGYNSGFEVESAIYQFQIMEDTAGSLVGQAINLIAPDDDLFTNDSSITFLWQSLPNAMTYSIQVADPDFSNSTFVFVDEETAEDNYSTTLPEGTYRWRVRAENDVSVSPYIERVLTIDLTSPNAPILDSPMNGDTVEIPTILSWNFDSSSTMDTLYVYTDSLLSPPILQVPTTDADFELDDSSSDSYFWRVRSVDAAGNTSAFSSLRKFYTQ